MSHARQRSRQAVSIALIAPTLLVVGMSSAAAAPLNPPLPAELAEGAGIINAGGLQWAKVLGKALFWDMQAGSDGQACASCHFHAGADTRTTNQLNPGFKDITFGADGDVTFGSNRSDTGAVLPGRMPSGAVAGSNYTLTPADLPMHRLSDETNRNSPIVTTTNDRVSSQGSFDTIFGKIKKKGEPCKDLDASIFRAGAYAARQVEPRNTPTTINAAFFHRLFWDGRANNQFNGVGGFGARDINGDPDKRLVVLDAKGQANLDALALNNAALASQAVVPPISTLEMSCDGRTFADLGLKLLGAKPLKDQTIDPNDSLLGPYRDPTGKGLAAPYTYEQLIKLAFEQKYWASTDKWSIADGQLKKGGKNHHRQIEINFPMFWGIAIMLYEATLVSDQSEFDNLTTPNGPVVAATAVGCFVPGPPAPLPPGVDSLWLRGCTIFFRAPGPPDASGVRGVGCVFCHANNNGFPLFAENAVVAGRTLPLFLTVRDVNNVMGLRDRGFANIGLRPVFSDRMSGAEDPYDSPLSFGRQYMRFLDGVPGAVVDPILQQAIDGHAVPARVSPPGNPANSEFVKLESDGSTKIPSMRNVALTPPYFSWGGYPTLRQVLKTYNRGMNRRDLPPNPTLEAHGTACTLGDDSGTGPLGDSTYAELQGTGTDCNTNTTGLIVPLGLSDCDAPSGSAPAIACGSKGHTTSTDDLAALERFLKSLTDARVQCDKAPFDHPSLTLFTGYTGADANRDGKADDTTFVFPAIGAGGFNPSASSFCIPNAGDLFFPGMQARSGGSKATPPVR